MKKLLIIFVIMILSISNIYGNIFDIEYTDNVYKFSDAPDIRLPYIKMSNERMIYDKDIYKSGIAFSNSNISVLNNLKGIHILTSSDTVRVNGNIEYGLIIAPTVIIEGVIDRTIAIIADNTTISENAVIKEDLICAIQTLNLNGNIEGNLLGSVEELNIKGNVLQDLRVYTDSINIDNNSNIQGNIHLYTYSDINLSGRYPNANIVTLERKENVNKLDIWKLFRISLIFALIYMLFKTKTNITSNMLNKVKNYKVFTILTGLGSIMLLPLLFILIIIPIVLGFGIITIPIAAIYTCYLVVGFMLSTLIVGSVINEYVITKYNEKLNTFWYKLIASICTFFVISILVNLPQVGYTISVAVSIFSLGIMFTTMFRKVK